MESHDWLRRRRTRIGGPHSPLPCSSGGPSPTAYKEPHLARPVHFRLARRNKHIKHLLQSGANGAVLGVASFSGN